MTETLFESQKPKLIGIAYRLLGSLSEAEDAVQDVFVKWLEHDSGKGVENSTAWLTKVCTNRCLDILKSGHKKRMSYVGSWLPEPLQTQTMVTPEDALELSNALGTAFLMVLERLTPKERAAYLLREVFDYDYDEAAATLGMSTVNCRQLVSRARTHIGRDIHRTTSTATQQAELLDVFMRAVESGDTSAFAQMLSETTELHADGGGKVVATQDILKGADVVEIFVRLGLHKAWYGLKINSAEINGEPGLILMRGRQVFGCVTCSIDLDGRAKHIFVMRNPDKLRQLGAIVQANPMSGSLLVSSQRVVLH